MTGTTELGKRGGGYGILGVCAGFGQGVAMVVDNPGYIEAVPARHHTDPFTAPRLIQSGADTIEPARYIDRKMASKRPPALMSVLAPSLEMDVQVERGNLSRHRRARGRHELGLPYVD
jgi:hypothetical protein